MAYIIFGASLLLIARVAPTGLDFLGLLAIGYGLVMLGIQYVESKISIKTTPTTKTS